MATSFKCLIFAWRTEECLWLTMTEHTFMDRIKVSIPNLATFLHTVEPLQLMQGVGKHCLPLIEQDDPVLPGYLGAASSAVSRWSHYQDQQLVQGYIMTYRWLRVSVNTSLPKGSLRKYGHTAQWDKGHGNDHGTQCLFLYALMPSMSLSSEVECGLMKYCPQ